MGLGSVSMEAPGQKVLKNLALDVGAMRRLEELHRNWRLGRPRSQRMMLADCDLRKLDLSLMDFTDAYFLRCNFERASLRGVVFRDAILTGSSFDEADLTGAVFERADLRGAVFHGSDMTRASLSAADLRKDFLPGHRGEQHRGLPLPRRPAGADRLRRRQADQRRFRRGLSAGRRFFRRRSPPHQFCRGPDPGPPPEGRRNGRRRFQRGGDGR